eukprot:g3684.t1
MKTGEVISKATVSTVEAVQPGLSYVKDGTLAGVERASEVATSLYCSAQPALKNVGDSLQSIGDAANEKYKALSGWMSSSSGWFKTERRDDGENLEVGGNLEDGDGL